MNKRENAHHERVTLLTTGNMTKGIFSIALPIILANSLVVVGELANAFFLGHFSSDAMAAVTMAGSIVFFIMTFNAGLSIGTVALVSRAYGERDYQKAEHVGTQSLMLGLLLSVILGITGYFLAPHMLYAMGARDHILLMATSYLHILFGGLFFLFFTFQVMAVFQEAGDTVTPMKIGAFSIALNICLDPILIFGLLGAPRMGVMGAALATLISRGIGVVLFARILLRGQHSVRIQHEKLRPDFGTMKRILMVGIPGSIQMMVRSSSMVVMTGLAALFGPATIATLGIGNRLFGMFLLPGFGFGAAASTMVGQNLGARNPARAEKSAFLIVGYYFTLAVVFAIPLFILSGTVARLFTTDGPTIILLTEFIKYLCVGALFISPGMMFSQSLQGAGATIYPMMGVIATLYGVQVPLAWFLGVHLHMEATGLWIANLASGFANAALMSVIFLGGRWKKKKV